MEHLIHIAEKDTKSKELSRIAVGCIISVALLLLIISNVKMKNVSCRSKTNGHLTVAW